MVRQNTILTSVEVRWIKNAYKQGKYGGNSPTKVFGCKRIADKINEGRKKVGMKSVSKDSVLRVVNKIKRGDAITTIDASANNIVCPKCGYHWYK